MAKKKQDDGEDVKFDIENFIQKKYGNVVRSASSILEQENDVYDTGSPNLNIALGGGFTPGVIEISGPPKCGKTTTFLQTLASHQAKGRTCFFCDCESRFKKMNLQIRGLDPDKLILISSSDEKILDGVDYLTIVENIIKNHRNAAIVIDSASSIMQREKAGEEINAQTRDTGAKLWSQFCKRNAGLINVQRTSLYIIRHTITNVSGYGSPFLEDCGRKLDYLADTKIRANSFSKWVEGEKQIGVIPKWNILCSSLGPPLDQPVESYIRFGYGIDDRREYFGIAVEFGLIGKSGAWYNFDFMDEPIKLQGESNCIQKFTENPELLELLKTKILELSV